MGVSGVALAMGFALKLKKKGPSKGDSSKNLKADQAAEENALAPAEELPDDPAEEPTEVPTQEVPEASIEVAMEEPVGQASMELVFAPAFSSLISLAVKNSQVSRSLLVCRHHIN